MQARGQLPGPAGGAATTSRGWSYRRRDRQRLGPNVTEPLQVGDRVFGIVGGGAQAEFVVTPPAHGRCRSPRAIDYDLAAAVPEVFMTAHDAIETQGLRPWPGERVLIHAVGSGVGTAAVQVAHAMGCTVLGTSRTAEKVRAGQGARARRRHPSRDRGPGRGRPASHRRRGGRPRDRPDRRPALADNLAVLATRGRLVLVGLLGGGTASVELTTLLRKRISVVGTTLRARPLEEEDRRDPAVRRAGRPLARARAGSTGVDRVFPFDDLRSAQLRVESNVGFGKVVIRL